MEGLLVRKPRGRIQDPVHVKLIRWAQLRLDFLGYLKLEASDGVSEHLKQGAANRETLAVCLQDAYREQCHVEARLVLRSKAKNGIGKVKQAEGQQGWLIT